MNEDDRRAEYIAEWAKIPADSDVQFAFKRSDVDNFLFLMFSLTGAIANIAQLESMSILDERRGAKTKEIKDKLNDVVPRLQAFSDSLMQRVARSSQNE